MYKGKYSSGKNPEKAEPMQNPPEKKRARRRPTVGTIVFYGIYAGLILCFCCLLFGALNALEDWLERYEASQPKVKCQEVFTELFSDPDWASLYTMSGEGNTRFEGKEQYAAYMENKVGGAALTYNETSAGLSGDHKYVVKLGNEKLAAFTLTASTGSETDIQEWKLGSVELFCTANRSVSICTKQGRRVFINGKALDGGDLVSTTHTLAETYLPEGVTGLRTNTYRVDGLLMPPQVTAEDETGAPVTLRYDAQTGVYTEEMPIFSYTEEEGERILGAAETYCEFMIRAVYENRLRQYFDAGSEVYNTIRKIDTWMQSYSGYRLGDGEISDFYRYSDDLFSAKVTMTMYVDRWDDSAKEYHLASTFFFTQMDGRWMVTDMTNLDVQKPVTEVRLTYLCDGRALSSVMVNAESGSLTPPAVPVPEGKRFAGWFREERDEKGNTTYHLVFLPDDSGTVTLPEGTRLEPMTLYALFDDKGDA